MSHYDESSVRQRLKRLRDQANATDAHGVQQAIFDLGASANDWWPKAPDEVVDGILLLLREPTIFSSPVAGHLLNYFEFESKRLTTPQKKRCTAFLKVFGDRFTDVHAVQVITELRYKEYLK